MQEAAYATLTSHLDAYWQSGSVPPRTGNRSHSRKLMRRCAIFKKRETGTTSGRRNSRCANGFKALRNHQCFRDPIGPGQKDKRGQDDRHGYEAIIETTTESVDPLGQISASRAHGRVSLLDPARITGR
jgi:hypothetical protein